MKNKNRNSLILGLVMLVISIVLTIGVKTVFHACGVHDDGSYGSCHWAEQAVFAMGIVMTLQSVIALIAGPGKAGAAISASIAVTAIVTALIPNIFIKLCMMPQMRCIASMRPAVVICSALLAVIAIVSVAVDLKGIRKDV